MIIMRRSDRQITNTSEISAILRSGSICYLSIMDDGRPYIVPLNYGYRDGKLYFHSAPEGRKIRLLRQNPEVCFCVVSNHRLIEGVKGCSWSTSYRSVIGAGRAEIVTEPEEIRTGLEILMAQYSERTYDFKEEDLIGVIMIRVDIEEMTGKDSS